jgi:ABC-2 type transport system ATP-binding protein
MEPVERICDRLLMLHRGEAVLYGSVDEVRGRFADGLVRIEHGSARLPDGVLPPGVTVRDASEPHRTMLLPSAGTTAGDVVSALLAAGVEMRGFSTRAPSLEEIFVRVAATPEPKI